MKNNKALALTVIGYTALGLGCLSGFIMLTQSELAATLSCIIAGVISCFLFLGFAEIIELLQQNLNIMRGMASAPNPPRFVAQNGGNHPQQPVPPKKPEVVPEEPLPPL